MLILANALTEAKSPVAFLVTMALFFAATYALGWVTVRIPLIKWITLTLWGLHVYRFPHTPVSWELPVFYMFWGLIAAHARYHLKNRNYHGGSSLSFPRMPKFSGMFGGMQGFGGFFSVLGRCIGGFFRILWKVISTLCYFLFIRLPVHLIRLGFWLKNIFPQLRTPKGWWKLIKGLFAWIRNLIWHMLPPEFRAEFRRGMHGKSATESYADDIRAAFEKEQEKQKRREEEELRRVFRKMKSFFKKEARAGRNPFEQTQEESGSNKQNQSTAENTHKRSRGEQGTNARDHRSSQEKKTEQGNDFWEQHQRETQNARQGRQGQQHGSKQSQQSRNSSKKASQNTTSSPPPSESKNLDSRSKAYFDKYRSDFTSAKWTYSAEEERFTGGKSAYEVLGVSTDSTKPQIKKAYYQLARTYMEFTNPYHPTTVQARANAIMAEVNFAKMKLLGK